MGRLLGRLPAFGLVLCCVAAVAATAVSQAQPSAVAAELLRLEAVWNDAHRTDDPEALARLWGDEIAIVVPGMAPMSKSDALAFARTGRMRFERYVTSAIEVRPYGATAIVTGRLQRTRVLGGQRREDDWQFTKVYVNERGTWRVVAFHASDSVAP